MKSSLSTRDLLKISNIYCCGITPNSFCHMGHVRILQGSVTVKILIEALKSKKVSLAVNWTDVEDGLLKRADSISKLFGLARVNVIRARRELRDFVRLDLIDNQPKVTDFLSLIIRDISRGLNLGRCRRLKDGIYLNPGLSHSLLKRSTKGDFALWKFRDKGYPAPFGRGIPGWHIECSSMINSLFKKVDLHLGGADLIFPHHVNEDLIHRQLHGSKVSDLWMHFGMINVRGEKMSKSLGNAISLKNFLPLHLRIYLSYFPYQKQINFSWTSYNSILGLFNKILIRLDLSRPLDIKDLRQEDFENLWLSNLSWWNFFKSTRDPRKTLSMLVKLKILPSWKILQRWNSIRTYLKVKRRFDLRDDLRLLILRTSGLVCQDQGLKTYYRLDLKDEM